jgi:glutamate-1-semialdehyde 2,1-aminomutase
MKSTKINNKIHKMIPGGSHTYSKGDDQFPSNAPKIMSHAKGAMCWDIDGNKFLDWAMGNRVMILGHAYDEVDNSVIKEIKKGTNFTRPGILEYELADYLVNLWPHAEMVKFGKNGSDVTTAAIKLARAYTGRKYVLVCGDHPFFSIHDWFIGSTVMNSGTLDSERVYTLKFSYNDTKGIDKIFEKYHNEIAAIILEPVKNDSPFSDPIKGDLTKAGINRGGVDSNHFLSYLRKKTKDTGTVLIFDEMISGMRFDINGAHHLYGVYPDLMTFGKAVSNGYSCSILAGKKELMELGGIHHKNERVFLLSQTHGSETVGIAATLATLKICDRLNVSDHVWSMGSKLKFDLLVLIENYGLNKYVRVIGFDANPHIICTNIDGSFWPELHTLMHQYLIEMGILIPWISITYSHNQEHLDYTINAFSGVFEKIKYAINESRVEEFLLGSAVRPVFRKWN